MEFGKLVKLKRKQRNITLSELAEETDLSISYLSRLENCERTPAVTIALTIAKSLNISVEEIEDSYGIYLNKREKNKEKEIILPKAEDYILIDEIKDILIKLAQGKAGLSNSILQVSNKMNLLYKESVYVTAKMGACRRAIYIKFYDEKIVRFLKRHLRDIGDDIMVISGYIEESDLETDTSDLERYLDVIEATYESDSYEVEEVEEIREYLKKINY